MTAKSKIENALLQIMDAGDANACQVYRGTDYGQGIQATGWWYRPFNSTPVYLGKSAAQALATIEDIRASREE